MFMTCDMSTIFMEPPGVGAACMFARRALPFKRHAGRRSMNVRTLIGEPIHRAEDFRFLKGEGRFIDDLKRDGMLHAVVLRSTVAHGRIRRIDAAAARAMPGVHAVMTAAEVGDVPLIPLPS